MSVSRSIESPDYRALPRSVGERQAALFTVKLVAVPLLLAPFTANPVLTISALCLLPLMTYLLWRPAEPPALLFATFISGCRYSTR